MARRGSRESRYRRLRRLHHGPFPALTVRYGRRYLARYPDDGRAWLLVGIELTNLARYEEAEQALARSRQSCPADARPLLQAQTGQLFRTAGDYDQAAGWYARAIEGDPGHASYRALLGSMLAQQGRFPEAEEALRAATRCERGRIDDAHFSLGLVLRTIERFAEAADAFRESLRINPDDRETRRALRDVELCLKFRGETRVRDVLPELGDRSWLAPVVEPGEAPRRGAIGGLEEARFRRLMRLGHRPFPALTALHGRRFSVAHPPGHGPTWMITGQALTKLTRYEEAEQAISRALELWPSARRRLPLSEMGHVFEEAGENDRAADWYARAIQADPEDASPRVYLGAVRARQGRFQEAEESHLAATRCAEGCIDEAHFNLGLVLRARERFAEAADRFREAIRIDPDYRDARRALRDVELCMRLAGEA